MSNTATCPLTTNEIIDEYFIENRTRVLELAAFLDRLERSSDGADAHNDFRIEAFHRALSILSASDSQKMDQIQMLFSDPTTEPKEKLDTKSASGAWNPIKEVA